MSEALASPSPSAATSHAEEPLVTCEDLTVRFVGRESTVHAVNGVNFALGAGEVLCIVGESGSGKSVTLRAMMRLLPARLTQITGKVTIAGKNVMALDRRALGHLRGAEVAMIFQEPMTSFDPVFTVGTQIMETLKRHERSVGARRQERAIELLEMVQIPSPARASTTIPMRCRAACGSAP